MDTSGSPNSVRTVHFSQQKYGQELLIDVAWIHDMPSFTKIEEPYRLDFYDITLISQGSGDFWLDTDRYGVQPGTVFFSSPGQVRRWVADDLDGICLFFPAAFLLEHFNDPLFLHRLRYFHNEGGSLALPLPPLAQQQLLERLNIMRQEIDGLQNDSPHLLRAIAYELLINLNRLYAKQFGQQLEASASRVISQFRKLVEQNFTNTRSVGAYAKSLGLTPGHLNFLCQKHLGRSAGDIIRARVVAEARRMLVHTQNDVGSIGTDLGFSDPSYFSRSFKRTTGLSPLAYRLHGRQELHAIS